MPRPPCGPAIMEPLPAGPLAFPDTPCCEPSPEPDARLPPNEPDPETEPPLEPNLPLRWAPLSEEPDLASEDCAPEGGKLPPWQVPSGPQTLPRPPCGPAIMEPLPAGPLAFPDTPCREPLPEPETLWPPPLPEPLSEPPFGETPPDT